MSIVMLANAPTYLFTPPAVGFVGLGTPVMLVSLLGVSVGGVTFGTHAVVTGSLVTIVGFQVGRLALFSGVAADPIKSPGDPPVTWTTERFRLEHGVGLLLAGAGGGYVALMVGRWVASGFTQPPFVEWNTVAVTAIVLGVRTTFQSFFLGLDAED